MKKCKEIIKSKDKGLQEIVHKVNYELTWWNKCDTSQKSNEEYMVQVYKPLKRLISAFDKKTMEIEQEKQFMA